MQQFHLILSFQLHILPLRSPPGACSWTSLQQLRQYRLAGATPVPTTPSTELTLWLLLSVRKDMTGTTHSSSFSGRVVNRKITSFGLLTTPLLENISQLYLSGFIKRPVSCYNCYNHGKPLSSYSLSCFISAKPTTKKNCRRQFFFGVGEVLLPSSSKKNIVCVPK